MSAAARPRGVQARAYAKLNLALAVGPRRPDGYHELFTVFQSVSLHDTLVARPRRRGFTLAVRGERRAARGVPASSGNLVLRAARRAARAAGLEGGARFTLTKRIPAGAGLGGGSSDAAAALRAVLRLYGVRLPPATRARLALELGADVPFFLRGGTALGAGRGERLRPLRLARPFRAVIVVPPWSSPTSEAYRRLDEGKIDLTGWMAKSRFFNTLGRRSSRVEELLRLGNDFEEVVPGDRAEIDYIREKLIAGGALGARLTGSGSAVFGVFGSGASLSSLVERFDPRRYRIHVVTPTKMGAWLRPLS